MKSIKSIGLFFLSLSFSLLSMFVFIAPTVAAVSSEPEIKTNPVVEESQAVRDWVVIPIFYATNRKFIGDSDHIQYSEDPSDTGLQFGVKNIVAQLPQKSPLSKETRSKMLWQRIHISRDSSAGPPDFDKNKCAVKDKLLGREEIVPALTAYIKNTGSEEGIIFIHGCCADFDTSMERTAKLAAHVQEPILFYDWVSPKGFKKYLENETRVQQTIDDFCRFLNKITTIIEPAHLTLIGHSMGSQFLDSAMVRRADKKAENSNIQPFKELILSNADIDALAFLHHAKEFASNATKTRIYFSKNDDRLNGSAFAHGFSRLGAPGPLINELAQIKIAQFIDITENGSGHEMPFWVIANLHKFNNLGPVKDFDLKDTGDNIFTLEHNNTTGLLIQSPLECACNN